MYVKKEETTYQITRKENRSKWLKRTRDGYWRSKKGKNLLECIDKHSVTSWQVLDWVASTSATTGNIRLVALQLALHYNSRSESARASYSVLEYETGLSRATIAKCIAHLTKDEDTAEWQIKILPKTSNDELRAEQCYVPIFRKTYNKVVSIEDSIEDTTDEPI